MTTSRETIDGILDALQADEDTLPEDITTCEVLNRAMDIPADDKETHESAEVVVEGIATMSFMNLQRAMVNGMMEGKDPEEIHADGVYAIKVAVIRGIQLGKKIGQGMFNE